MVRLNMPDNLLCLCKATLETRGAQSKRGISSRAFAEVAVKALSGLVCAQPSQIGWGQQVG